MTSALSTEPRASLPLPTRPQRSHFISTVGAAAPAQNRNGEASFKKHKCVHDVHGSNIHSLQKVETTHVHQPMNREVSCGLSMQWNITRP